MTEILVLTNRSASYLEMGCFQNALTDAEESMRLAPNWWKGIS